MRSPALVEVPVPEVCISDGIHIQMGWQTPQGSMTPPVSDPNNAANQDRTACAPDALRAPRTTPAVRCMPYLHKNPARTPFPQRVTSYHCSPGVKLLVGAPRTVYWWTAPRHASCIGQVGAQGALGIIAEIGLNGGWCTLHRWNCGDD